MAPLPVPPARAAARRRLRSSSSADLLLGRVHGDLADTTVDRDHRAERHVHDADGLDHGGNARAGTPGSRCGLVGPPAAVTMPRQVSVVKRGGLGRSQVVRGQDRRLGERRHTRLGLAQQPGDRAIPHVAQVGDPLGHVAAERLEHGAVLLNRGRNGVRDALAGLQLGVDAHGQARVTGHHRAGLEDRLGVGARRRRSGIKPLGDVLQCAADPVGGCGGISGRSLVRGRLSRWAHHHQGPHSGAGADADAVEGGVQAVAGHRTTPRRDRGTAVRPASPVPRPRRRPLRTT